MKQALLFTCAAGALFTLAGVSRAADKAVTFTKDIAPIDTVFSGR
jgi:hypothetical protein